MVCSRFSCGIILRVAVLTATLAALIFVLLKTAWFATALLLAAAVVYQIYAVIAAATAAERELARFLEALSFDDAMRTFSVADHTPVSPELAAAMEAVMAQLRDGRAAAEEEAHYRQALLIHMPVALIACAASGEVQLLNPAARRLFEGPLVAMADCARYGEEFSAGLTMLEPGQSALLKMARSGESLYLKVAATAVIRHGVRQTIYSFQNIAGELNAQELAAWQTVIRTMAHEVMNSLTPISSLSATAGEIVRSVRDDAMSAQARASALNDAVDALETVARRAEGLMSFVQNHRRLTRRLTAAPQRLAVERVFARLQRLLAADIAARGIALSVRVEPPTLEVTADADLLDQALINLLRNAMDAVRESPAAAIALAALRDGDGRTVLSVADNGPGIDPAIRERIFVPFYTTKRQGTGIGLTLVRQIAAVHDAALTVGEAPGGGALFRMRF